MDTENMEMFGPFAAALAIILDCAESFRQDKIVCGEQTLKLQPQHPLGTMCDSFIVFRGTELHDHSLSAYAEAIGKKYFTDTQIDDLIERFNYPQDQVEAEKMDFK